MSTYGEIVTHALRALNVLRLGETPATEQMTEGVQELNLVMHNLIHNVANSSIRNIVVVNDLVVDYNTRVTVPSTASSSVTLHLPLPPATFSCDGGLVNVVRVTTREIDIDPRGLKIDGSSNSVTLTGDMSGIMLVYHADEGNWRRLADGQESTESAFPRQFDNALVSSLAIQLSSRYTTAVSQYMVSNKVDGERSLRGHYQKMATNAQHGYDSLSDLGDFHSPVSFSGESDAMGVRSGYGAGGFGFSHGLPRNPVHVASIEYDHLSNGRLRLTTRLSDGETYSTELDPPPDGPAGPAGTTFRPVPSEVDFSGQRVYLGWDGPWLVRTITRDSGDISDADMSNNPTLVNLSQAWAGRTGLVYS